MAWNRGGLAWAASEAACVFVKFSVGAIVIFIVQVPFLIANAVLDRVSVSGSRPGVWLRAIVRSFVFALIVMLPLFAMVTYEVLYLPPGQGMLNSDQIGAPLTLDEKRREVIADLKILPIQIALLAAIAMIVQAPFVLARRA
ncbi:MAG: hypothetical protein K8S25_02090 [Alphaproteobacteria bacterium]|nr:hypothetical protein [Alphaproteobacteria bacterium]